MTPQFDGNCSTCQSVQGKISLKNAPRILETTHWLVEHAHPTSVQGWLVLVLRRHALSLHELTPAEAAEFGRLLPLACQALHLTLQTEKEYVMQFAEKEGFGHVHFHVIARLPNWPDGLKGPAVFSGLGAQVENPLPAETTAPLALAIRDYLLPRWYELIIFDVDGTLAEIYSTRLLPGVLDWFKNRPDEVDVAIATNQGGVGLRYWMEKEGFGNPAGYPTAEAIEKRMRQLTKKLGLSWENVYVAYAYRQKKSGELGPIPPQLSSSPYWRHDWRKPAAGMLKQAMRDYGTAPARTLMVGDSPDDQAAAVAAGCAFMWARDFFDWQ
jgi:HAD superfamily hydrolase (TIGR01662 family)